MKRLALFMTVGLFCAGVSGTAFADAMTLTQLELTGGAVNYEGEHGTMMDRLLAQEGTLNLGQFQAIGELVPSIDKAGETYSLFTSGFTEASAPSATISGSAISVDLSSLFFGTSRGDFHKTWNIGGLATGQYNPETREFTVSWNHMFDRERHDKPATFFLSGQATFGTQPAPVPLPTSIVLYVSGFFGLGSWVWWQRRVPSLAVA